MPIQIGHGPAHDFDEPLELLSDCHRRIEHFLRVLVSVDAEARGGALTSEYRSALEGSLRYFEVAAPRHTQDEEASLFPRMRESGDRAATEALSLIERLEQDHQEADSHHAAVDVLVKRWLRDNALAPPEAAELRDRLARLQALYERHIGVEDREVFPAAARVLDRTQIRQIGREMAERRQVRHDPPGDDSAPVQRG